VPDSAGSRFAPSHINVSAEVTKIVAE